MIVTVFAKASCQPCRLTGMKLDQKRIEFVTRRVDQDPDAKAKAESYGYLAAPVVVVDLGGGAEWSWAGYRPSEIERLQKMLNGHDPERVVAA